MKSNALRLAAFALLATFPMASTARAAITRRPYLQNVQKTSAIVMWESDQAADPKVRFGADEKVERTVQAQPVKLETLRPGAAVPTAGGPKPEELPPPTAHVYEARIEGLSPGQDVYYQVEDAGEWTPMRRFKTTPEMADKFRFVAYGDTRTRPLMHAAVAARILQSNPDFILQTGDFVSRGQDYRQWTEQFFQPIQDVLDHIPIWPSIGNHEGDAVNYHNLFNLPGDEVTYSFDYGPAHFAAIDSIGSTADKMAEWLEKDLAASKAKWKFVYYHIPTYNAGGHHSAWGRGTMTEVYRRNHVDAVFTGHSHLYERTFPIKSSYGDDPWPVTYFVTGGGGAPLYDLAEADYLAKKARVNHAMVIDIEGDKLTGRVITDQGEEIDAFAIDKSAEGFKEYAKAAISEELTDFVDDLKNALEKNTPQAKAGEPAQVEFKLVNKRVREPVQVTLKVEKGPSVQSIEPESLTIAIGPGEEKIAAFKLTAAVDTITAIKLSDAEKEFMRRVQKEKKKEIGRGLSVPLVQLSVHYETAIGHGDFELPTLTARGQ